MSGFAMSRQFKFIWLPLIIMAACLLVAWPYWLGVPVPAWLLPVQALLFPLLMALLVWLIALPVRAVLLGFGAAVLGMFGR